jgi:hypothetical protein
MRKIGMAFLAGLIAALLGTTAAQAQSGAACSIQSMAPQIISASTFPLTSNNQCNTLVFTNPSGTVVTLPNAATGMPVGFSVAIIPAGQGGVTLQPTVSTIMGQASGVLAQGEGVSLLADGANYWVAYGPPIGIAPAQAAGGLIPGTTPANGSVYPLPNAVLQFTNPASFVPGGYPFALCGAAPMALMAKGGQKALTPRWLQIIDNLGLPGLIPLC